MGGVDTHARAGGTADKVGGPFSKDGAVGKQFESDGKIGVPCPLVSWCWLL